MKRTNYKKLFEELLEHYRKICKYQKSFVDSLEEGTVLEKKTCFKDIRTNIKKTYLTFRKGEKYHQIEFQEEKND